MSRELFNRLKNLNLPLGKYAVFGSGPICARGLRECRDLDVIITQEIFNNYKKMSGWERKEMRAGVIYLDNNDIEFWRDWAPGDWDILELINNAEIIDDIPFVRIEDVLKWKKLLGREKDLKDIELINNYLNK